MHPVLMWEVLSISLFLLSQKRANFSEGLAARRHKCKQTWIPDNVPQMKTNFQEIHDKGEKICRKLSELYKFRRRYKAFPMASHVPPHGCMSMQDIVKHVCDEANRPYKKYVFSKDHTIRQQAKPGSTKALAGRVHPISHEWLHRQAYNVESKSGDVLAGAYTEAEWDEHTPLQKLVAVLYLAHKKLDPTTPAEGREAVACLAKGPGEYFGRGGVTKESLENWQAIVTHVNSLDTEVKVTPLQRASCLASACEAVCRS